MSGRHRSAWELVHGEAEQVVYWKWRVRRLEAIAPLSIMGAFMVGFLVGCWFMRTFGILP